MIIKFRFSQYLILVSSLISAVTTSSAAQLPPPATCIKIDDPGGAPALPGGQLAQEAARFFKGDDLITAVAIAYAESRFFPEDVTTNTNCTKDYGLWQNNDTKSPATQACPLGSKSEFTPTVSAQDFYCLVTHAEWDLSRTHPGGGGLMGFDVSNAYRCRTGISDPNPNIGSRIPCSQQDVLNWNDALLFASSAVIDHISVFPPTATIDLSSSPTLQLTATAFLIDNTSRDVQSGLGLLNGFWWRTADPSKVEVTSTGMATGHAVSTSPVTIAAAVMGKPQSPSGTSQITVICSTNCGGSGVGGSGSAGSGGAGGTGAGGPNAGGNSQSEFAGNIIGPLDPNDKAGSQGVGIRQYISGETPLRYAVFFTNEANASAPAQNVVVTDQLNVATDDLNTFSLGPIALPNQVVVPPAGSSDFSTTADLRPANNILVAVNAHLDKSTGLLTWTFQSLDPATNQPPADPLAGFLPPSIGGSTLFTVMPKAEVATDTRIQNEAVVVFDQNPSISTPVRFNTIDKDEPISHVLALSAQSLPSISLQWVGTDVGAGVQDFTIFVSDNGSPFTPFLTNTTASSASFSGQPGHTYAFFSTARDLVGNVEDLKTTAEATTTVVADAIPPTTSVTSAPPPNANGWNNSPQPTTPAVPACSRSTSARPAQSQSPQRTSLAARPLR
jgi:hypothetical protein